MSISRNRTATPLTLGLLAGVALGLSMAVPGSAQAQGVSNGVATVDGYSAGQPIIHYGPGATPGISSGIFNLRGGSEGGARVEPGPGAHGNFADGGIPVFNPGGGGEVTYQPAPVAPQSLALAPPPAPQAPMTLAAAPSPRALPESVRGELASAEMAMEHGRLPVAEARIEAAQTTLLNDRRDGEHGWRQPIQQLETALDALRHNNPRQAEAVVMPLSHQG
jgi:hypothetical protein